MKSLSFWTILAALLIAFANTGCDKEDEKTVEELLIGKWEIKFLAKVAYVDNVYLGDTTLTFAPGNLWIQFKDDNTGFVRDAATNDYNFTWSLNEDIITFKVNGQSDLYFHFIVDETELTWYVKMYEGPYTQNPAKVYREMWYHWAERI
jgi:hypothetical protein